MNEEQLQLKMNALIYYMTKNLAKRGEWADLLEWCGIEEDEYQQIKDAWKEKFNITPYV